MRKDNRIGCGCFLLIVVGIPTLMSIQDYLHALAHPLPKSNDPNTFIVPIDESDGGGYTVQKRLTFTGEVEIALDCHGHSQMIGLRTSNFGYLECYLDDGQGECSYSPEIAELQPVETQVGLTDYTRCHIATVTGIFTVQDCNSDGVCTTHPTHLDANTNVILDSISDKLGPRRDSRDD